jgi:hypothetical protein
MSKDKRTLKHKKAIDAEISSTLFDDFERFEYFFVTYWKRIIYLCIAIVIGVALVGVIIAWQKNAEAKVNALFAKAQTKTEIVAALAAYPDAPAAFYAKLHLAKIYVQDKEFDKAFELYTQLSKSVIPAEMQWRVELDEAYALELCGKFDLAAAKFLTCSASTFIPEAFRCEANYGAGRLFLQLNNIANAEKYLNKVKNAVAMSRQGSAPDMAVDFWQRLASAMLHRIPADKKTPANSTSDKKSLGKS